MEQIYSWNWVQQQVTQTIDVWNSCASQREQGARQYSPREQQDRENAYDEALDAVEREVKRLPRTKCEKLAAQNRIVALFARFSAAALDLERDAIDALTNDFLPVGTGLARWARKFDPALGMADIIQACRNAWTACGLQPLLGAPVGLTPSILGYSLLYPYSDNFLDQMGVSRQEKLRFSARFRRLLEGEDPAEPDSCDKALRALIHLIETQYPRGLYPDVFNCLLAIHRAQEESIRQLASHNRYDRPGVLRVSCAKGGSSVLADACLVRGRLTGEESRFAFEWGVLLQLGDDLQDLREDTWRGSVTLFSQAAASGKPLDGLATQLLEFSESVGARMDRLSNGDQAFKDLLRMSWRSLIIRAVAESHEFFSPAFLKAMEPCSPFRFAFLRARQERLASQQGLYARLFDAFLQAPEGDHELPAIPSSFDWQRSGVDPALV